MKRAAIVLMLMAATARADWHPDFSNDLANVGQDLAVLTNLLAAVNERCEATFYGATVDGSTTTRLYQVAPLELIQTWTNYDFNSLTSAVIEGVTNFYPASTNVVTTNAAAVQPWEIAVGLASRTLDLAPWYVCTTSDVDASVLASNGPPMWTASNLLAYTGSTNIFGVGLPRQAERDTTFALGQLYIERTRRLLYTSPGQGGITGIYTRTDYAEWTGPGIIWSGIANFAIGETTAAPLAIASSAGRFPPLGVWYESAFPYSATGWLSTVTNVDAFAAYLDQGQLLGDMVDLSSPALSGEILIFTNIPRVVVVGEALTTGALAGVSVTIQGEVGSISNALYTHAAGQSETVALAGLTNYCTRIWHNITNMVLVGEVPAGLHAARVETHGRHYMAGTPARQVYRETLVAIYKCLREMKDTAPGYEFWSETTISTSREAGVSSPVNCYDFASGSTTSIGLRGLTGFERRDESHAATFYKNEGGGLFTAADYSGSYRVSETIVGVDAAVISDRLGLPGGRRWRYASSNSTNPPPTVGRWRHEEGEPVGSLTTNGVRIALFAYVARPGVDPNEPEPDPEPSVWIPDCLDDPIGEGGYFDNWTASQNDLYYNEKNTITLRWPFSHPAR